VWQVVPDTGCGGIECPVADRRVTCPRYDEGMVDAEGSHSLGYKKRQDFPGPQKPFPVPYRKQAMVEYSNTQQLWAWGSL